MLEICNRFGLEYSVQYNAKKSKFIVFEDKYEEYDLDVCLGGKNLDRVSEIEFLGNIIRADLSEKSDVKEKQGSFYSSVNTVKFKFSGAAYYVKVKLFSTLCFHAYGAEIWKFRDRSTESFWNAWGRGARRMLGVPPSCPSAILHSIMGVNGGKQAIMKKFVRLAECFRDSDNDRMQFIYDIAMCDNRSIMRGNLEFIKEEWNGKVKPPRFEPVQSPECEVVKEMLEIRDGFRASDLIKEDVDAILMLVCTR